MGHHAGLADYEGELSRRLEENEPEEMKHLALALKGNPPESILIPLSSGDLLAPLKDGRDISFFIRMLFSALVDADFLDTEAYMDAQKQALRERAICLPDMVLQLNSYLIEKNQKALQSDTDKTLNQARTDVLEACRNAALHSPGFFSLTVPTGGGKTLSSLAFALKHAVAYQKRRVIYAIPYTSIIEQTAQTFRDVFRGLSNDAVIEHHSNLGESHDSDKETSRQRLASENWDAPLIVTTTVQLFESLYANRTSRCRKLHNIADSIIILDEAHLMPPELRTPILHALHQLVNYYGVSVVLCTATPTGLEQMQKEGKYVAGLHPIIPPSSCKTLYDTLKRVRVELREGVLESWEPLAEELARYEQVLCIVSRRDDCRDLHALMPEGTIHLSALMCAEHRSHVIADIKKRLENKQPVRVISTQLVEAGVDVDFPVVYRAMAGLDSIAQAAGRCNREGTLKEGKVVVFRPMRGAPAGVLRQAEQAAEDILRRYPVESILSTDAQSDYFNAFYDCFDGDKKKILSSLKADKPLSPVWLEHLLKQYDIATVLHRRMPPHYRFKEAAQNFQMVEDHNLPVIVHYHDKEGKWNDELLKSLLYGKPSRNLLRKAQRYTVNVPQNIIDKLLKMPVSPIIEIQSLGIFVQSMPDGCTVPDFYDKKVGLAKEYKIVGNIENYIS